MEPAFAEAVRDRLSAWREGRYPQGTPLHGALGWSEDEFSAFVAGNAGVPDDRPLPPIPAAAAAPSLRGGRPRLVGMGGVAALSFALAVALHAAVAELEGRT